MKTLKIFTLICIFIGFLSHDVICQTGFTSDYIALTVPQHYIGKLVYVNDSLKQEIKNVFEVKNNKSLLKSFPNIVSNVTVYSKKADGSLAIAGVGISAKDEEYQVIYDYSQSQTLFYTSDTALVNSIIDSASVTSALVGIGVRMVAKIKTKKAGINLTSPLSLVVNYEKIVGSLEVRVTGIASPTINGLIPTTTDLSPSSISLALQAVATIKSHIYDDDVTITPQYLAYNKRDGTIDPTKLRIKD